MPVCVASYDDETTHSLLFLETAEICRVRKTHARPCFSIPHAGSNRDMQTWGMREEEMERGMPDRVTDGKRKSRLRKGKAEKDMNKSDIVGEVDGEGMKGQNKR